MITRRKLTGLELQGKISKLDDDELKQRLERLPVEQQVDLFLGSDWSDRLRIIKNSGAAPEVVKRLPEEEVLLTIKGTGEQDALPLVALTTPTQLRFILDVELWHRDRIEEEKARKWLRYVLSCGEHKVIQLFRSVDRELAALLLSRLIYLIPNEENARPLPEGLPTIMPDEFFTIVAKVPDEAANIELLLRILRGWDRDRFYDLLFDVYGRLGAETEEEAYRWRSSRLEEKGLLEFEEAIEIYGYVGEDEARRMAKHAPQIYYRKEVQQGAPTYPIILGEKETFLYQILVSIDDEGLANRLRAEIAFAANRVLVADAEAIGEIDAIKHALNRVYSLVNLGLLFLVGNDHETAIETLRSVPLKDLFQIGFSRVLDLKTLAQEVVRRWWPEWRTRGFILLEYPRDEIMRGVLMRVPQYYALAHGEGVEFRDFRTMDEVHETREAIEHTGAVAQVFFDRLGLPKPHKARLVLRDVFAQGIEDINLRSLLVTGFLHYALYGDFKIETVTKQDARKLFEEVLVRGEDGRRVIKAEVKQQFLNWLKGGADCNSQRWEKVKAFVVESFEKFEDEIAFIASWEDLDPRYVTSLIFSRKPE